MSDSPAGSSAWRVDPCAYLERRPARFRLPDRPHSIHLPMRDGIRLAVDVYLPQAANGDETAGAFPTILLFTPYYRRFRLVPDAPAATEPSPNAGRYRDLFVPRGYALVVIDVRGTGASFGVRDSFRSPAEREDFREVVAWVAEQSWCSGSVGATGISYVGAAADFLASTGHPAIKAIAPISSVWDTYGDHYYPGGVLLTNLAEAYNELMIALDHDRRDLLPKFAYFKDPNLAGPAPVDDDPEGALVAEAVREHLGNFHMPDFIHEFPFRDSALAYDPTFTTASFSPYRYAAEVRPDVAVLSISGWYDGGGYMNGAASRFLSLPNVRRHLLLGPWDHGGRVNGSPFRRQEEAEFPLLAEILRFFDEYLAGEATGLLDEAPVHYFAVGAETWRTAQAWPPPARNRRLFLGADGLLAEQPGPAGGDRYRVDYACGTGRHTRYGRLAAEDTREYYHDWHGRDARMLCYTSGPLEADLEIAGHPLVELHMASDKTDATVFVYLEDVGPDGGCRYVTEGVLRALHRKEADPPSLHKVVGPYHSCRQADARPLEPEVPARLAFALLPIAWRVPAGHRIRVAIAGADREHFTRLPHGRPGNWRILHGGSSASWIELPVAWQGVDQE